MRLWVCLSLLVTGCFGDVPALMSADDGGENADGAQQSSDAALGSSDGAMSADGGTPAMDLGPLPPSGEDPTPIVCNGNCVYVRAGSSGDGSDWSAAVPQLPATMSRGKIYFVAGGSYGSATLSTLASGTTPITIKGATVANHGTDVGWSDSYAVETTQARFSGITFKTSYWIFDGSVGHLSSNPSSYGFQINPSTTGVYVVGAAIGASFTDIRVSHVYSKAVSGDLDKPFMSTHTQIGVLSNFTISHSLIDGYQAVMVSNGQGAGSATNWICESNLLLNLYSSAAHHGEWINPNGKSMSGLVVRYNIFRGHAAGGATGSIVANNSSNTGAKIYGNVFDTQLVGNGVITGTSAGQMTNAQVFNNTFYNCSTGPWISGPGSGNVARNNLIVNMSGSIGSGWSVDYNAYYSAAGSPTEGNKQIETDADPFVDRAGFDYRLVTNTDPGMAMAAEFQYDALGVERTTWTRGAFEFVP